MGRLLLDQKCYLSSLEPFSISGDDIRLHKRHLWGVKLFVLAEGRPARWQSQYLPALLLTSTLTWLDHPRRSEG